MKGIDIVNIKIILVFIFGWNYLAAAVSTPKDLARKGAIRITPLCGHTKEITAVALSPDGNLAAAASLDGIKLWNIKNRQCLFEIPNFPGVHSMTFSPDSGLIAAASENLGRVVVWRLSSGLRVRSLKSYPGRAIDFYSDDCLAIGEKDCYKLWKFGEDKPFKINCPTVNSVLVSFNPHGDLIAFGSEEFVNVYHTKESKFRRVRCAREVSGSVSISADDRLIAIVSKVGKVLVQSTKCNDKKFILGGGFIRLALFASDSDFIITASMDNSIRLWSLNPAKKLKHGLVKCNGCITAMAITHQHIMVGFAGGRVEVYTNIFAKQRMRDFLMARHSRVGVNSAARVLDLNLNQLIYGELSASWEEVFGLTMERH